MKKSSGGKQTNSNGTMVFLRLQHRHDGRTLRWCVEHLRSAPSRRCGVCVLQHSARQRHFLRRRRHDAAAFLLRPRFHRHSLRFPRLMRLLRHTPRFSRRPRRVSRGHPALHAQRRRRSFTSRSQACRFPGTHPPWRASAAPRRPRRSPHPHRPPPSSRRHPPHPSRSSHRRAASLSPLASPSPRCAGRFPTGATAATT